MRLTFTEQEIQQELNKIYLEEDDLLMEGEWLEAPGYAVLDTLYEKIPGLELVAEDLGDLRPQVLELRDHYHLKGMKVLEFALDTSGKYVQDIEPNRQQQIYYTGTHDNATLLEWYHSLSTAQRRKLRRWLKRQGFGTGSVVEPLRPGKPGGVGHSAFAGYHGAGRRCPHEYPRHGGLP